MKINEYQRVDSIKDSDVFILDRVGVGTRGIEGRKMSPTFESMILSPKNRKVLYRGKYLGSSLTDTQFMSVKNGTFDDMFIGDYWTINGINWLIADFDFFRPTVPHNYVDTQGDHDMILISGMPVYKSKFANSNFTTTSGTYNSLIHNLMKSGGAVRNIVLNCFRADQLLERRHIMNAGLNTDGTMENTEIVRLDVWIPNEIMLYGWPIKDKAYISRTGVLSHSVSLGQLAIFRLNPALRQGDKPASSFDYYALDSYASNTEKVEYSNLGDNTTTTEISRFETNIRPYVIIGGI